MWTAIATGVGTLFSSWIDLKKSKHESEAAYNRQIVANEATWDLMALKQAQYSWKDELITIIWYYPLIRVWFEVDNVQEWIDFVSNTPLWYQIGCFGIMSASFGLRWYFKQQNFKIGAK